MPYYNDFPKFKYYIYKLTISFVFKKKNEKQTKKNIIVTLKTI